MKKLVKESRPPSTDTATKKQFQAHDGFYRLVVENLEDYAIFTTDEHALVTSWNSGAEKLLGYKPAEILASDIEVIFSPKDHEKQTLKKEFIKAAQEGRSISEGYHFRKDGSTFWASCLIFPLEASIKHEEGYTFILRDLTHQKEIEQRKDDFINIASHELKTPMTSIKIFASIIENQAKKSGDEILANFISKLNIQIAGLGKLINRLLDVSQLQNGKLEIKRRPFNFNSLAEEVIAAMQQYSKESEIRYVSKADKSLKVNGDKELISQILVNLLSNGIKYSPEKGRVVFTVKEAKNRIVVSIQDHGIGIAPNEQDKVFQRFFRTEAARKNKISGVGLGLYIVKEIVTGHGGKIWVESTEGKGSTFFFTLPIK